MKRRRPKEHRKLVAVGRGRRYRKRAIINRGIKKYITLSKQANINPQKRSIFEFVSNPKNFQTETGGFMDFDKKGLERFTLEFGKAGTVDLTHDPDWETDWHTHVLMDNILTFLPSTEDIIDLRLAQKRKTSLLFSGNIVIIMTKTPKFNRLTSNMGKDELFKFIKDKVKKTEDVAKNNLIEKYGKDEADNIIDLKKELTMDLFNEAYLPFKKDFEEIGLNIKLISPDKKIIFPLKVVEHVRPYKKIIFPLKVNDNVLG